MTHRASVLTAGYTLIQLGAFPTREDAEATARALYDEMDDVIRWYYWDDADEAHPEYGTLWLKKPEPDRIPLVFRDSKTLEQENEEWKRMMNEELARINRNQYKRRVTNDREE